jgi:hypothetical protein
VPHISSPAKPVQVNPDAITISSDDEQRPLVIVQRNVYDEPVDPVKVDVGFDGALITPPVPLTMVHSPVPTEGELPASVADIIPPDGVAFWSAPALAVVGPAVNVITTSSDVAVHGLLDIVHLNT